MADVKHQSQKHINIRKGDFVDLIDPSGQEISKRCVIYSFKQLYPDKKNIDTIITNVIYVYNINNYKEQYQVYNNNEDKYVARCIKKINIDIRQPNSNDIYRVMRNNMESYVSYEMDVIFISNILLDGVDMNNIRLIDVVNILKHKKWNFSALYINKNITLNDIFANIDLDWPNKVLESERLESKRLESEEFSDEEGNIRENKFENIVRKRALDPYYLEESVKDFQYMTIGDILRD